MFDGNLATYTDQVDTGPGGAVAYLYWSPSPTIGVNSLRIYGSWYKAGQNPYVDYDQVSINGNPYVGNAGATATFAWWDLTSYLTTYSITTITNITFQRTPIGGNRVDPNIAAVEVNGSILINAAPADNDSLVDTPTSIAATDTGVGGEIRGNYATFNALVLNGNTLSNGNLDYLAGSANKPTLATIGIPNTGKWYFEFTDVDSTGSFTAGVGSASVGASSYLGADANGWGYQTHPSNAGYHNSGVFTTTGRINGAGSNTILGVAIDRDTQKIWFSVNGTYVNSGVPASGTNAQYSNLPSSGELFPGASTGSSQNIVFNAGQRAFAYTAPSGFKALCDTNLGDPLVAKPNELMDAVIYTGNGSTQTISGLGFSPDFLWFKSRSNSGQHRLYDTIRGATNAVYSNLTNAEESDPNTLTAFNSSGFSLGSSDGVNESSWTYVAWAWDAGTSTVSNTAGSITSQVRANVSAGFSVVTYTGDLSSSGTSTVGHGLGVAPTMIIFKRRDGTSSWPVQHSGLPSANNLLYLNETAATSTSAYGTIVAPTSTVFTVAWITGMGVSGQTHVAYCFAPVVGYSSFGSYVGGSNPFVYLGFRPRFILFKATSAGNWDIYDSSRTPYNEANLTLSPNLSGAEYNAGSSGIDLLSNGFKLDGGQNASTTYIYAAFAENPFQYARAR
jgi:hypothetical protein